MGQDHRRRRRRRRHGAAGVDRISGLPDELLGCILLRLGSTRAAARTSVLSHRWRRVWTHLPDLRLGTCDDHPGAMRLDTVDSALDACAAAASAVRCLNVGMHCHGLRVQAPRVAPWLRFASHRRVEELSIEVPSQKRFWLASSRGRTKEEDIEFPVWDEAKNIAVTLDQRWRLRLAPAAAGLFVGLTDLYICQATMEASELGHLVSSQCPRLRNLCLIFLSLAALSDLTIRSDSLHSIELRIENARGIEIIAPKLEVLSISDATEAHIYAPKLDEVTWDGEIAYDPHLHRFVDAGRHLGLLDLGTKCAVASLLQRFDKADVLKLNLNLWETLETLVGYKSFLKETIKLPKCDTLKLWVSIGDCYLNLASSILHLLRSCNSTRKISIKVDSGVPIPNDSCQLYCPHCRLPESSNADSITLDEVEEVKITLIRSSCKEVEFVEQLAKCHAPSLKKLVINCERWSDSPTSKEIQEKVCRMFNPDVDVKFNVS